MIVECLQHCLSSGPVGGNRQIDAWLFKAGGQVLWGLGCVDVATVSRTFRRGYDVLLQFPLKSPAKGIPEPHGYGCLSNPTLPAMLILTKHVLDPPHKQALLGGMIADEQGRRLHYQVVESRPLDGHAHGAVGIRLATRPLQLDVNPHICHLLSISRFDLIVGSVVPSVLGLNHELSTIKYGRPESLLRVLLEQAVVVALR